MHVEEFFNFIHINNVLITVEENLRISESRSSLYYSQVKWLLINYNQNIFLNKL